MTPDQQLSKAALYLYILSKGTTVERELSVQISTAPLSYQFLCSADSVLSISLFLSAVSSLISIMISRLLPWSIQSTIQHKKS
jgi:hypothetical protein